MKIILDEARLARYQKIAKVLSFVGLGLMAVTMLITVRGDEENFIYAVVGFPIAWIIAQVGIYLTRKYGRKPRVDTVLNGAFKKAVPRGRMYHWVLPASHVLLTDAGPIVIHPKPQDGVISASGDKWTHKGNAFLRFFGGERLGDPTKEVEADVGALAKFLREKAPELDEVPIAAMIVFTAPELKDLDVKKSRVPAMYHKKVKGFMRNKQGVPLSAETYNLLLKAFDTEAGDLVDD